VAATKKKPPTMKDVAERVGVSVQTISAVINDKPGITQETRARVLEAVQQLGYRPYSVARSLRTGRTRTIALIVSDIANPSFATMASAAEDYAHTFGYSLLVFNTHDDSERENSYIRTASQSWIDGVLFVSAADQMTSLDAFQAANIPPVAIDRIPEHYDGPSVTLDNVHAGCIAAEHLMNLGHTRIAHISGPMKLRLARERRNGFLQALADKGLTPGMVNEGDWTCASGYAAMQQLLQSHPRPTAVFAANDRMAIGAIHAISEAGLSVPEDISIVGLDDIEVAAYQIPPLTTIRQPFSELGTRAVRLLLEIIESGQASQRQIVIDPLLVARQSTAAPRP
jgi:DNA-binding LacI/PurR family transcriptional regulator